MGKQLPPFHLAFPVRDIEETRDFYVGVLGCGVGRSTDDWVDFDFFGHQVVAHRVDGDQWSAPNSDVDGHKVPARHFGVVLDWDEWQALADKMTAAGTDFIIEPYIRFEGQPGEQATMFFSDPSGNALEFKSFRDQNNLFANEH